MREAMGVPRPPRFVPVSRTRQFCEKPERRTAAGTLLTTWLANTQVGSACLSIRAERSAFTPPIFPMLPAKIKEKYKCEQQAVIHFSKKVPHEQRKHGQYHSRQKLVWCHTEYAQQAQHEQYAQRGQAARVVSVHISHGDGDGPGRHEQHAHAQQRKAGRRKGQHGAEKIGGGQGKTIVEKKDSADCQQAWPCCLDWPRRSAVR